MLLSDGNDDFLDGGNGVDVLRGGSGADEWLNGEAVTGCEVVAPRPNRSLTRTTARAARTP
jgi:hypothetical protein